MVTSGSRNISKRWSAWKNFNRISSANIGTSTGATRYISKRWSTSKISIAFLAPISWLAALATSPNLGRLQKIFNRIFRAIIVTSATRNISKAWSTSKNFNRISRANNIVTSSTRNISKRWSTSKNFNRISRANIVTSGTRNISKAWPTSKNYNRISRANIVTSCTRITLNGCSIFFIRISAF